MAGTLNEQKGWHRQHSNVRNSEWLIVVQVQLVLENEMGDD
jgi:hypothetical protein